jgi:hypothetical protein
MILYSAKNHKLFILLNEEIPWDCGKYAIKLKHLKISTQVWSSFNKGIIITMEFWYFIHQNFKSVWYSWRDQWNEKQAVLVLLSSNQFKNGNEKYNISHVSIIIICHFIRTNRETATSFLKNNEKKNDNYLTKFTKLQNSFSKLWMHR